MARKKNNIEYPNELEIIGLRHLKNKETMNYVVETLEFDNKMNLVIDEGKE